MLVAVVILLSVIVVLLCLPQKQRGPSLVKLLGIGAIVAAVYYLGPLLLGIGVIGLETIRHSKTTHSIIHLLGDAFLFVFVGIPILFVFYVLVLDLWKKTRANPREMLRRFAVVGGKAILGFVIFSLYVAGMLQVISRFYVVGLLIYLLLGFLVTVMFLAWRRKRNSVNRCPPANGAARRVIESGPEG